MSKTMSQRCVEFIVAPLSTNAKPTDPSTPEGAALQALVTNLASLPSVTQVYQSQQVEDPSKFIIVTSTHSPILCLDHLPQTL